MTGFSTDRPIPMTGCADAVTGNECGTYHIRRESTVFTARKAEMWHVPHSPLARLQTTWRRANFTFVSPWNCALAAQKEVREPRLPHFFSSGSAPSLITCRSGPGPADDGHLIHHPLGPAELLGHPEHIADI